MRRFIRHPTGIPIEVRVNGSVALPVPDLRRVLDVGLGGIAFEFFHALEPGATIVLRIPAVRPPFESVARVVWCRPAGRGFRVGAEFLHEQDEFRARMVEQVCEIERYRQRVREDDQRELSAEEAAQEWIEKFAARFPRAGSGEP